MPASSTGMTSSSPPSSRSGSARARGAAGEDAVDRRGEPLAAQRLEEVVDRADLVGVHRPVVVGGDEHHRRGHGHRGEHPGELQPVEPGHADVEEDDLDIGALGHARAGHRVGHPAAQLTCGGGLAHALPAVEDAEGVGGVGSLEHHPDPSVLAEQVGQFLESGLLVVHGEDDEAAGAVVAVHDLLILRVRGLAPPTMVTANAYECQGPTPVGCVWSHPATDRTVPRSRGLQPPAPPRAEHRRPVRRRPPATRPDPTGRGTACGPPPAPAARRRSVR